MRLDPEGIERSYLHQMGELSDARVLEVGSGDGRSIWQYAAATANVVGVDPDIATISEAVRDYPAPIADKAHFAVAQCEALPFVDKAFDGAIFAWSL
jgi:ubiquinone/menaquinone biosynthesis C-methylase UbiE